MVRLEVIAGPMFSGKSEELIRRINTAIYADKKILVLKPKTDTRYGPGKIVTRKKNLKNGSFEPFFELDAHQIGGADEALELIKIHEPEFLAFDEAQFFGEWLVDLISALLASVKGDLTITISGLDMNFKGEPFGIMPRMMAMADSITKLKAVCFKCKGKNGHAVLSKKISGGSQEIEIGNNEKYEARCRKCFFE